jgi:hypothetical protein
MDTMDTISIDRVIAAVQRTSHLPLFDMFSNFPELYEIRAQFREESERRKLREILHNSIGRCPIGDQGYFAKS